MISDRVGLDSRSLNPSSMSSLPYAPSEVCSESKSPFAFSVRGLPTLESVSSCRTRKESQRPMKKRNGPPANVSLHV